MAKKESSVPKLEDEIAYGIEKFIDDTWPNERQPTLGEFQVIVAEAHEKVDSAKEAYRVYVASGAFECCICGRTHYRLAPTDCRDAYNSGRF